MDMIASFKKKNYICFINVKNLNNHIKIIFVILREKILISLTIKVEREFV